MPFCADGYAGISIDGHCSYPRARASPEPADGYAGISIDGHAGTVTFTNGIDRRRIRRHLDRLTRMSVKLLSSVDRRRIRRHLDRLTPGIWWVSELANCADGYAGISIDGHPRNWTGCPPTRADGYAGISIDGHSVAWAMWRPLWADGYAGISIDGHLTPDVTDRGRFRCRRIRRHLDRLTRIGLPACRLIIPADGYAGISIDGHYRRGLIELVPGSADGYAGISIDGHEESPAGKQLDCIADGYAGISIDGHWLALSGRGRFGADGYAGISIDGHVCMTLLTGHQRWPTDTPASRSTDTTCHGRGGVPSRADGYAGISIDGHGQSGGH